MRYAPRELVTDPLKIREAFEKDDNVGANELQDHFDAVYNPPHYTVWNWAKNQILCQVRDIQRHATRNLTGMLAADIANAIKYLCRAPFKGKMKQDLKKANFHINAAIEKLDAEPDTEMRINSLKEAA